jgi:hypothetical protein
VIDAFGEGTTMGAVQFYDGPGAAGDASMDVRFIGGRLAMGVATNNSPPGTGYMVNWLCTQPYINHLAFIGVQMQVGFSGYQIYAPSEYANIVFESCSIDVPAFNWGGTLSLSNTVNPVTPTFTGGGTIASPQLFMTGIASAPTYTKGGIYYDTTLSKLRIGGATSWETVNSI